MVDQFLDGMSLCRERSCRGVHPTVMDPCLFSIFRDLLNFNRSGLFICKKFEILLQLYIKKDPWPQGNAIPSLRLQLAKRDGAWGRISYDPLS